MGVQGLWTLIEPTARPVQLETLRNRKMAVDASIWMHQFMRTMRDKEGNALRNGHLLGFFRRLCKLLFYNIKPVFVFDGGAPELKRTTIRGRRQRREGVVTNMKRTAEKILSAQVKQRVLYEEEQKRQQPQNDEQQAINLEEMERAAALQEIKQKYRRDQYELPPLAGESNRHQHDPRLATQQELIDFINDYRPSEQDIDTEAFQALPPEVQYEIVQDLKLKSRQTSWARLDEMVRQSRTALDFSKQQIKQLMHRNAMTQRMMEMDGLASKQESAPVRIAGERSREYLLVKNENFNEGLGWKLPGTNVPDKTMTSTHVQEMHNENNAPLETGDKVQDAIASNPKLAALLQNIDDSGEEEEGWIDTTYDKSQDRMNESEDDDDEPLFLPHDIKPTPVFRPDDLLEDMNAYADDNDEAMQAVLQQIYADETHQNNETMVPESSIPDTMKQQESPDESPLDPDAMYTLWLSKVPDAFIYLHSMNDEYKQIIHDIVYDHDLDQLEKRLKRVQKLFGKTNDRDEMAQESLAFQQQFLSAMINWKKASNATNESTTPEHKSPTPEVSTTAIDLTNATPKSEKPIDMAPSPESVDILDGDGNQDIITIDEYERQKTKTLKNDAANMDGNIPCEIDSSKDVTASPHTHDSDLTINSIDTKDRLDEIPADDITLTDRDAMVMEEKEQHDSKTMEETAVPDEIEYGYNSDQELVDNVEAEENEYARFVSDLAQKDIDSVRDELYKDMKELNKQQRKEMGNTDEITRQMTQDIQELLRLFGIPFVVSPMEAEAQCAELVNLSLVEGIVTDDSDVFLFGGSRIYKNMFNQQKYVECYMTTDIEREMRLDRGKLVQIAFLLGSDYTDGIPGIGPVAAIEILAEFSRDEDKDIIDPLRRFREWYESGHDNNDFQKKLRKKHKVIDFPHDFPNPLVVNAYYHPMVDDSKQAFEWGTPQLDTLRDYLMQSFGWSEGKADEVLLPVIKEMNKRKAEGQQSNIISFFGGSTNMATTNVAPHKRRVHKSKRVQNVISRWRQDNDEDKEK
ncbi:PIN domain-like protein, partial [Lichtheimia hyalospora FSU 10163]